LDAKQPRQWVKLTSLPSKSFTTPANLKLCSMSSLSEFIAAAKIGERDPVRLREAALRGLRNRDPVA